MLKAEAVDLKAFPIYIDFGRLPDIKSVYQELRKRQALDTLEEIETPEHKFIDAIVFEHLAIEPQRQSLLVHLLKKKINERTEKSKT
jgi:hypothetical protein